MGRMQLTIRPLQDAEDAAAFRGAGRALLVAAIEHACGLGARSLFLGSSTRLADAVHLYGSVGFVHVPSERLHMPYARADVFLELVLDQPAQRASHAGLRA